MKLKSVEIAGFRSIEKMDLNFSENGHKILVGKNESGKSNILKALNMLSGSKNLIKNHKKELYDPDMFIRFVFDIEQKTLKELYRKLIRKFFIKDKSTIITDKYSVEEFCSAICPTAVMYKVKEQSKNWLPKFKSEELEKDILSGGLILEGSNWYHLNPDIFSAHPDLTKIPSKSHLPPTTSYLNEDRVNQFTEQEQEKIREYLSPITLKDIYQNLKNFIIESIIPSNDFSFPVIKWKYNKKDHGLPKDINRNDFADDPNTCIPLKNMFLLSGIQEEDIGKEIVEKFNLGSNHFTNLLNKVNKKTNEYIKNSWKEFIDVKLELRKDGSNIVIGIQDSKNIFDFRQRSAGFRRLISFLLLMSVEEQTPEKQQKLILIDEPEVGLHPGSARDLRNKLIELGKNHWVVYATHSISMIDTENIENNLIVSRKEENTTIKPAKEDGTSPAEMVYRAIGYSIYEELKQKNILLEGYTDKKILRLFMTGSDWRDFGICYTKGVTHIEHVTSILDLGGRKYCILSDSDEIAIRAKKKMGAPKYWYTYKDLGSSAITIEDFYKKDFFLTVVKKVLKNNNINNPEVENLPEDDRIAFITKFLKKINLKNNSNENLKKADMNNLVKKVVCEIKEQCVQKMNKNNVDQEKLKKVLNNFLEKINK